LISASVDRVSATASSAAPAALTGRGRLGVALAILLIAQFMGQFDFFVVNVAAPRLREDLGASDAGLQLIVGAYAFAYAAGLVAGGRLGDTHGHRRMFITGMLAFTVTSLLCGVSPNEIVLIVARLLQGASAALMLPQVLALITLTGNAATRARSMAWYGVAGGAGAVAGQVLGGFLVTADVLGLGWRLIFLVNVPIGLVTAVLARRWVPAGRGSGPAPVDAAGAVGLALTLGLVLVPLTLGRDLRWPWWIWAGPVAAVLVGLATAAAERAYRRRGRTPLLDGTLLRHRSFVRGLWANSAFMLYFASYMFTMALLLQTGLGLSAFRAGLAFAPSAVAFAGCALAGRGLRERYGDPVVVAGSLLTAAGLAGLALLCTLDSPRPSVPLIILLTIVLSGGNGLVLPALIGAALADVPHPSAGSAAGVLTTAQQFAGAAGVALIGAIFFAIARAGAGPAGVASAMTWACVINVVLSLAVAALTAAGIRASRPI